MCVLFCFVFSKKNWVCAKQLSRGCALIRSNTVNAMKKCLRLLLTLEIIQGKQGQKYQIL